MLRFAVDIQFMACLLFEIHLPKRHASPPPPLPVRVEVDDAQLEDPSVCVVGYVSPVVVW